MAIGSFCLVMRFYSEFSRYCFNFPLFWNFVVSLGDPKKVGKGSSGDACRVLESIGREIGLKGRVCQPKFSLGVGPCYRHKCSC